MYLDLAFAVYYYLYFIVTFFAQLFLLFMIVFHTPSSFMEMRRLLISTSITQLIMCTSAFLTQVRIVPIENSIALLSFGPCSLFGPYGCYTTYNFLNTSTCAVVMSLLHLMYYRRNLTGRVTTQRFIVTTIITYFLPFIVLIFSFLGPTDFNFVRTLVRQYYPYIDLNEYTLSGFSNVNGFFCFTATFIVALHSFIPPFLSIYWRRVIVEKIRVHSGVFSTKTQLQTTNFVKCLTWQTCFPLFFLILPYSFYLLQQLTGMGFEFTQYFVFAFSSLPAAMDPFFVFYFIHPYRKKAKYIFSVLFRNSASSSSSSTLVAITSVNSRTL